MLIRSKCVEGLEGGLTSSYLKKPKDTAATSVVVTSLLTTTAMTGEISPGALAAGECLAW